MRIDKFLKVSRLIKRRTVANDACDAAHISVNGKVVKASYDVKVGDVIAITFGEKTLRVRVTDVRESTKRRTPPNCTRSSGSKRKQEKKRTNSVGATAESRAFVPFYPRLLLTGELAR